MGHAVARSSDAKGSMIGRSDTDPILDTRMYQVEFAGHEVTELTTNFIAETMYAQCNSEGNEYSLFEALIDNCKHNKAVSF